jgi:hypothetical protein
LALGEIAGARPLGLNPVEHKNWYSPDIEAQNTSWLLRNFPCGYPEAHKNLRHLKKVR